MRALSLVRAWLYGVFAFAAMTVSLVLAFSIAIAGPPTNEEMTSLGRALGIGLARAGVAIDRLAVRFCDETDLCQERQAASVEEPAAPIPDESVAPPAPPLRQAERSEPAPDDQAVDLALMGGGDRAAPVRAEPTRRARPPQRRRAVRTPPPPITVERPDPIEQLAERVEEMLAQVPAAYEVELGPNQDEQIPQSDPYEDEWREEEAWDEPPPEELYYERETF